MSGIQVLPIGGAAYVHSPVDGGSIPVKGGAVTLRCLSTGAKPVRIQRVTMAVVHEEAKAHGIAVALAECTMCYIGCNGLPDTHAWFVDSVFHGRVPFHVRVTRGGDVTLDEERAAGSAVKFTDQGPGEGSVEKLGLRVEEVGGRWVVEIAHGPLVVALTARGALALDAQEVKLTTSGLEEFVLAGLAIEARMG